MLKQQLITQLHFGFNQYQAGRRLLCQSRLKSAAPALLTSASAHTCHFGRQSFACVWMLFSWALLTCSVSLSAQRTVSSGDYLYLIGYLYMQPLFVLHPTPNAGMVVGLKKAANSWKGNEKIELKKKKKKIRHLQVCDTNKKQINSLYTSIQMPVTSSKLKLYSQHF